MGRKRRWRQKIMKEELELFIVLVRLDYLRWVQTGQMPEGGK